MFPGGAISNQISLPFGFVAAEAREKLESYLFCFLNLILFLHPCVFFLYVWKFGFLNVKAKSATLQRILYFGYFCSDSNTRVSTLVLSNIKLTKNTKFSKIFFSPDLLSSNFNGVLCSFNKKRQFNLV